MLRDQSYLVDLQVTGEVKQNFNCRLGLTAIYKKFPLYVILLVHKKPVLKIFDIDAGTGAGVEPDASSTKPGNST